MIYSSVAPDSPIRQGDIFIKVPRVRVPFSSLRIISESNQNDAEVVNWRDLKDAPMPSVAALPIDSVPAIVISQDCDAARETEISLCEIKPFKELEQNIEKAKPQKRPNVIITNALKNLKWFYLPPDLMLGFQEKMAVDFRSTLCLRRKDLVQMIDLRRGRLNDIAYDHFRERLAHFFRRYAYNEWYSLDHEEFEFYRADRAGEPIEPYDWQK